MEPKILLMDEPCSSLDPISTLIIEELIRQLSKTMGIVLVTHNYQQAWNVSNKVMVMRNGAIIEEGPTEKVMMEPDDEYVRALMLFGDHVVPINGESPLESLWRSIQRQKEAQSLLLSKP